jgi:hypothetical protein
VKKPSVQLWLCLTVFVLVGNGFAVSSLNQTAQTEDDDEVLARIGPRTLTVRDLRDRIELTPWPGKDNPGTLDSARTKALLSLVAETLLSMEAVERGLVASPNNVAELASLEKALARDALYRREILSKISVSQSEVEYGLERYAWQMTVNSYRVDSKEHASRILHAVLTGRPLAATDLQGVLVHDTLVITFGDLAAAGEDSIYSLDSLHRCTMLHLPDQRWVVAQFIKKEINPAFARANFDERAHVVRERTKKRKEHALLTTYVQNYFPGKVNMNPVLFRTIADSIVALLMNNAKHAPKEQALTLSQQGIEELRAALVQVANEPFITSENASVSLGTIIDEMNYHPMQFRSLKRRSVHERLNQLLKSVADAALASQRAMRLQLHHAEEVRRDMRCWVDALQAGRLLASIVDSLGRVGNSTVDHGTSTSLSVNRNAKRVDGMIASLARKFGVQFYTEKLQRVTVTPFNMITKRYLGFGGMMLAKPMLLQLWEWGNAWNATEVVRP